MAVGAVRREAGRETGKRAVPAPLQLDLFSCDLLEVAPKEDLASMEHPLFSLATRPDLTILRYLHNGVQIEVTPSVKGRATIHDKDILIYCTSQLMAALNGGRAVARRVTLRAHDLLVATERDTSGDGYRRLREALERLAGTRITTNLVQGGLEVTRGFGLIEDWEILRKTGAGARSGAKSGAGRMVQVQVTLSEWLYAAIMAKSVLTLNRDYFQLRRPLERRLYELARKHCGRQPDWRIGLETLQKKTGSQSPRRVFRAMLREVIAADTIPDYLLTLEAGDLLTVRPRVLAMLEPVLPQPALAADTLEIARARAPGMDIYALVAEWQARQGAPTPDPDAAFLRWLAGRG